MIRDCWIRLFVPVFAFTFKVIFFKFKSLKKLKENNLCNMLRIIIKMRNKLPLQSSTEYYSLFCFYALKGG